MKNIPIFITSFNRLSMLKSLISKLEEKGYTNIQIIDNNSSYPPLLEYLKNTKHKVHFLNQNLGHKAFWECGKFDDIIQNEYYVVTDPDVLPIDNCPDDFIELFYEILQKNPDFTKAGFSLKIDDIPIENEQRNFIINWEKNFYKIGIQYKFKELTFKIYDSEIDTTFALYKPNKNPILDCGKAIRTDYPYECRHLPWYKNSKQSLNEEDLYYQETVKQGISNYSIDISSKELYKKFSKTKKQLKLIEKVFSVKNSEDKRYKIVCVLGIKIKIPKKCRIKT